jgi:hypothetical protein
MSRDTSVSLFPASPSPTQGVAFHNEVLKGLLFGLIWVRAKTTLQGALCRGATRFVDGAFVAPEHSEVPLGAGSGFWGVHAVGIGIPRRAAVRDWKCSDFL